VDLGELSYFGFWEVVVLSTSYVLTLGEELEEHDYKLKHSWGRNVIFSIDINYLVEGI